MIRLRRIEDMTGGCWTGIKFHYEGVPEGEQPDQPMRFCEAVMASRTRPIILTPKLVDCPGARRSFGWAPDGDETLAAAMADKSGLLPETTRSLISGIPRLETPPAAITVGTYDKPDVAISYAQSESAMRLLRRWQAESGRALPAEISSVMAVCGSVAVRAHLTGQLCLSFGCPESRKYGVIGRDRLVVGLSLALVGKLVA